MFPTTVVVFIFIIILYVCNAIFQPTIALRIFIITIIIIIIIIILIIIIIIITMMMILFFFVFIIIIIITICTSKAKKIGAERDRGRWMEAEKSEKKERR